MQSCHAKTRLVQDQARSLRNCNHCPPLARGGMLDAFCNGFWILLKPWYCASSCEGQESIPLKFGSHDGRFLKRKSKIFKYIYIYVYIYIYIYIYIYMYISNSERMKKKHVYCLQTLHADCNHVLHGIHSIPTYSLCSMKKAWPAHQTQTIVN